jgi:ADP-heptose:LPS heptosyltransferase
MERNLDLIRALGVPDHPLPSGGIPLAAEELSTARRIAHGLAAGPAGYAVLSPGASIGQAYKRPPLSLLATAAQEIARAGIVPIAVYGPGEEDDAERLARAGAARKAPPTSLRVLAALLTQARMFVGGDSGPLHLACAAGCPVLGLYGPTDPVVNRPWGVPAVALAPPGREYTGIKSRDRTRGFEGLDDDAVRRAVRDVLALAPPQVLGA